MGLWSNLQVGRARSYGNANPVYQTGVHSSGDTIQVQSSSHQTPTTHDHRPEFASILVVVSRNMVHILVYVIVPSSMVDMNPKYMFCCGHLPWTPRNLTLTPLRAPKSSTSAAAPRADGGSVSPAPGPWPRCPASPGDGPRPRQAAEPRSARGRGRRRRAKGSNLETSSPEKRRKRVIFYMDHHGP